MQGQGLLLLGDGEESFEGEFRNGLPWGKGVRHWQNGDTYEGDYFKGYQ